jgi:hypothetical protein
LADIPVGWVCVRVDNLAPNETREEWFTLLSGPMGIRGKSEHDKIAILLELRLDVVCVLAESW